MNWYYMDGDQQQGPVSDDVIKILVNSGMIGIGSLIRTEGMSDWWTVDQGMIDKIQGTAQGGTGCAPQPTPQPTSRPKAAGVPPQGAQAAAAPSLVKLRIAAACVDLALLFMIGAGCSRIMVSEWFGGTHHVVPWHSAWAQGWAIFSVIWLAFGKVCGISPGQCLLGIKIEAKNGAKVGFLRLLVRWLASWGLAYEGILLFSVNAGGLFLGDADSMVATRFGIVAAIVLVLATPLLITRGRRSLQDLVSGCAAYLSFDGGLHKARAAAACALVLAALAAQGYDFWKGFVEGVHDSQEGRFSVWFPGVPETVKNEGKVCTSAVVGFPPVAFSVAYSDLQEGEHYDIDKEVAATAEGEGQIYWSEDIAHRGALGRRWRLTFPNRELLRGDGEENVIWVTGDRVYRLRIRGSCKQMDKMSKSVNRLFTQSFRFHVTSPARLAPPKPETPYTPQPYSTPF